MRMMAAGWALVVSAAIGVVGCSSESTSCDTAIQRAHATVEVRDLQTGATVWTTTTPWLHGATYDAASGVLTAFPYGRNGGPTHLAISLTDGSVEKLSGPALFGGAGPIAPVAGEGVTVTIQQPVPEGTAPVSGPATAVATGADGRQMWQYELDRPSPVQLLVAGDRVVLISNDLVATRCP